MICYKDMTFCKHYEDCRHSSTNGGTCDRPLTQQVRIDARLWWGKPDPPIAVFSNKPSCHEPLPEDHEQ